jgi:hypothetical protein
MKLFDEPLVTNIITTHNTIEQQHKQKQIAATAYLFID